jgi:hypothetical protein
MRLLTPLRVLATACCDWYLISLTPRSSTKVPTKAILSFLPFIILMKVNIFHIHKDEWQMKNSFSDPHVFPFDIFAGIPAPESAVRTDKELMRVPECLATFFTTSL